MHVDPEPPGGLLFVTNLEPVQGDERSNAGSRPAMPVREAIEQYSDREAGKIAEWAASDRLLRIDEELIRENFDVLPFERLWSHIQATQGRVAASSGPRWAPA